MKEDLEQLKLLSLFHYIVAGITALFGFFPIGHLIIGIGMLTGKIPMGNNNNDAIPLAIFGVLFSGVAIVMMAGIWILAGCMFMVGRRLKAHRNRTFCTIVAAFECMIMPFGTVLGIFTLIVLQRPSVRELFDQPQEPTEIDPWQTPELQR
jgi:hypothetical protein